MAEKVESHEDKPLYIAIEYPSDDDQDSTNPIPELDNLTLACGNEKSASEESDQESVPEEYTDEEFSMETVDGESWTVLNSSQGSIPDNSLRSQLAKV